MELFVASVLKEYLKVFKGDSKYSSSMIERETLAIFNGLVAGLGVDSDGYIPMTHH